MRSSNLLGSLKIDDIINHTFKKMSFRNIKKGFYNYRILVSIKEKTGRIQNQKLC